MDLKLKDVADLLNVSETTVRRWLADGKIPAYRLNHQYRFSRIEIENWMMKCKLRPINESNPELPFEGKPEETLRSGSQHFSLFRAIHRGNVYTEIDAATKEEIILSTVPLIADHLQRDADMLAELLLDREKMMPTALGCGIAIPHARDCLPDVSFDLVTVVFPKEPIEYGALDGEKVHTLFFLFASNDKTHLHLLAKIAHLTSDPEALAFLKTRPERAALLEFVREWEGVLHPAHFS